MGDNGLSVLPEMEGEAQALEEQGKTVIFVAVDGVCACVCVFPPPPPTFSCPLYSMEHAMMKLNLVQF